MTNLELYVHGHAIKHLRMIRGDSIRIWRESTAKLPRIACEVGRAS